MITAISEAIDLIPDWLAGEHANIYLPWTMAMNARPHDNRVTHAGRFTVTRP